MPGSVDSAEGRPQPVLLPGTCRGSTRVFTLKDGWVWIFCVVEHWNAECLGWQVCKEGHRFNALQPVSMAIQEAFGAVGPDVARGVSLRMDHVVGDGARQMDRLHRGVFVGKDGLFAQRTEITQLQHRFFKALDVPPPPRFLAITPSDQRAAEEAG